MVKVMQKTQIFVGVLFMVLTALFINAPAHAEINKYEAHIADSLQVMIPSSLIDVAVDPASRPFDSDDFSITVSTNNATGYYMTMSSSSTNLEKTEDASKTIPTLDALEGGYTADTFTTNRWGYKKGSDNYQPFVSGTRIAGTDGTANADTTTLTFATKVDFLQSSGTYENDLVFAIVANPLPTFIQNLDYSLCTTDPMIVVDNRDNQEYTVQRLADGNCWMMDNLNLGSADLVQDLTSWNTNLKDTISAETFSGWRSSFNPYGSPNFSVPTFEVLNPDYNVPAGTTYDYCAISAGTFCYESSEYHDNASTIYDICPKGWRLPVNNEFEALYNIPEYNSFEKMTAPISEGGLQFALSYYFDGGNSGYYWTSEEEGRYNSSMIKTLYLSKTNNSVTTGQSEFRSHSNSARCVLDPTMQGFTKFDADSLAEGSSILLTDARDKQQYNVTKIGGNVWMTRNLAIGCDGAGTTYGSNPIGPTLDNYSSNLSSNYTLSTIDSHINCDSTYGAWYDYHTAIAETMVNNTAADGSPAGGYSANYSICPAGWHLPAAATIYNTDWADYVDSFGQLDGGRWYGGSLSNYITGWWGASDDYGYSRRNLWYDSGNGTLRASDPSYWGYCNPWDSQQFIRCVFKYQE